MIDKNRENSGQKASNYAGLKDIAHYQRYDPASFGFMYNTRKAPFNDINFRRALTYVFNKQAIRQIGNFYGQESPQYSILGIPASFIDKWVPVEIRDKMTKYSYDPSKADSLLNEIGWKRDTPKNIC